MRNRALYDALRAFTERAAEHLAGAVEAGAEVPFEVGQETARGPAVLYRYRSLSARFVRERFAELERIEEHEAAVEALSRVAGIPAYVRVVERGEVPASHREQARLALCGFLARVWDDVTIFEWDQERFERAYEDLQTTLYDEAVIATVIAPIFGLRLEGARLDLGSGLELSIPDLADAPDEALAATGDGQSRPSGIAIFRSEIAPEDPPPLTAARVELRKLVTTLRLFKAGSFACGSTAWWQMGESAWRAVPLGVCGRPRAGEYVLGAGEDEQVAELLALVRKGPPAGGPLPWAIARFEMGCERPVAVEGLSDHLLVLRALLDGDHASASGVALRLAALCAEPDRRRVLQGRAEQAFMLERQLMRGHLDADFLALTGADSPDTIARELEDNLRAILRDIVCGYLIGDLKGVADDLLLADPVDGVRPNAVEADGQDANAEEAKAEAEEPGDPPEFVVRRGAGGGPEKPSRERSKRWQRTVDDAEEIETKLETKGRKKHSRDSEDEDSAEPVTEESAAVRVPAQEPADHGGNWGFDDDPSDYSAAV